MFCVHGRPGGDLLSHALRRSTIGAEGFHGRVRDGIGCWDPRYGHQTVNERKTVFAADSVTDPGRRGGAFGPSRPAPGSSDCGSYGMMCFESLIGFVLPALRSGVCRCARWSPRSFPVRGGAGESNRDQADRAISTSKLHTLLRFHTWPINVVVFHGSRRDLVLRWVSRLDAFSGYPVRI